LKHVTDAGGGSPIVFQNQIVPLLVPNQVGAADVNVDVFRHGRSHELPAKEGAFVNQPRIDHTVAQDELVVIDILQKEIQSRQPLHQTLFDAVPFAGGNNSRNWIHGP